MGVMAEPYFVPLQPHWAGDLEGCVVVLSRTGSNSALLILKERGKRFVVAVWRKMTIIGVCLP